MSRKPSQPPPAAPLPFFVKRDGDPYEMRIGPTPGNATAVYVADERAVVIRSKSSAEALVNNFKAAVSIIDTMDRADALQREHVAVLGMVEELGRLVEAALPAQHVVARRFFSALDGLTDDREPSPGVLADALDEFDARCPLRNAAAS